MHKFINVFAFILVLFHALAFFLGLYPFVDDIASKSWLPDHKMLRGLVVPCLCLMIFLLTYLSASVVFNQLGSTKKYSQLYK